jgi:hypothetical protein
MHSCMPTVSLLFHELAGNHGRNKTQFCDLSSNARAAQFILDFAWMSILFQNTMYQTMLPPWHHLTLLVCWIRKNGTGAKTTSHFADWVRSDACIMVLTRRNQYQWTWTKFGNVFQWQNSITYRDISMQRKHLKVKTVNRTSTIFNLHALTLNPMWP